MGLRTAATVLIIVIGLLFLWMFIAEPFVAVTEELNETENVSIQGEDMNPLFGQLQQSFFDMFWVAIFGVMAWGGFRVLRRELTRGRRP